jgi:hypothetical protein
VVLQKNATINHVIAPECSTYKNQQNGDRQGMSKAIQHALTIANFTIDQPAPLEINRKIATMGRGGAILIVSKKGLSLFGVWRFEKVGLLPKKTF